MTAGVTLAEPSLWGKIPYIVLAVFLIVSMLVSVWKKSKNSFTAVICVGVLAACWGYAESVHYHLDVAANKNAPVLVAEISSRYGAAPVSDSAFLNAVRRYRVSQDGDEWKFPATIFRFNDHIEEECSMALYPERGALNLLCEDSQPPTSETTKNERK